MRKAVTRKSLARGTGIIVVRCTFDPQSSTSKDDTLAAFTQAVAECGVLRTTGKSTVRESGTILELGVPVEYGPVLGCYSSDLQRQAESVALKLRAMDSGVLRFQRHEVQAADVDAQLASLEAQVDDITLPIATRQNISRMIERLRPAR